MADHANIGQTISGGAGGLNNPDALRRGLIEARTLLLPGSVTKELLSSSLFPPTTPMQAPGFHDDAAKQEFENGSGDTVARGDHNHALTYLPVGSDRSKGDADSDWVDPIGSIEDGIAPPEDDENRRIVSWDFDTDYPVDPGPTHVFARFTRDNGATWSDYVLVGVAPPSIDYLTYVAPSEWDFSDTTNVRAEYVVQMPKADRGTALKLVRTNADGYVESGFIGPLYDDVSTGSAFGSHHFGGYYFGSYHFRGTVTTAGADGIVTVTGGIKDASPQAYGVTPAASSVPVTGADGTLDPEFVPFGPRDRVSSTTEVVNTTTETTFYSYTVPGGALGTDKRLRVDLILDFLNNTGSGQTFTLKVVFGATTMFVDTTGTLATNTARRPIRLSVWLSADGSASAQILNGVLTVGATSAATGIGGLSSASTPLQGGTLGGTAAESSASDLALELKVTLSSASSNLSLRMRSAVAELV